MERLDINQTNVMTPEEILKYGIRSIALASPGPYSDPCYQAKREFIDFANHILKHMEFVEKKLPPVKTKGKS